MPAVLSPLDNDLFHKYFEVQKIRGRDEAHIYKNYNADLPKMNLESFFKSTFQEIKNKNDLVSAEMRQAGNILYGVKDFEECYRIYSTSLRNASYGSENYATALSNRSSVFYETNNYKDCLNDIDLCLKAKCLNSIKPKVLLRKAKCLLYLGRIKEMATVLNELLDFLNKTSELSEEIVETHRVLAKEMLEIKKTDMKMIAETYQQNIPHLEENPAFLNASNAVSLRYNKHMGRFVAAKQDISQGQILFVEKAYAFSPSFNTDEKKIIEYENCQYCLLQVKSFVPCKICVKYVFCTEHCRDLAWKEFHRWECLAVRSGLFDKLGNTSLAFRIVLKAAHSAFYTNPTDYTQDIIQYGDRDNAYTYVHALCTHFENMNKETAMKLAACSVITVNYLQQKTDFFVWLKKHPTFLKISDKELHSRVGSLLLRHFAQFSCNAIHIEGVDEKEISKTKIGMAVCPSISMMTHSCMPNVSFYFVGDVAVVKALRKINANEKICYAYMQLTHYSLGKFERRLILAELCCFKCGCQACNNPDYEVMDSYLCVKCKNPAPFIRELFLFKSLCMCLTCKHKFAVSDHMQLVEALVGKYLEKFKESHHFEDGKRCIELATSLVNSDHQIFESIYTALLEYYIHYKADLVNFMKYLKIVIRLRNKRYGFVVFENGAFVFKMCTKLLQVIDGYSSKALLTALKEVKPILQEAKLIFDLYYPPYNDYIMKMETRFTTKETYLNSIDRNGAGDFFSNHVCTCYDEDDDDDDYDDLFDLDCDSTD